MLDMTTTSQSKEICPYLGQENDRETAYLFSSPLNLCHASKPVHSVRLTHQGTCCLTSDYQTCPLFIKGPGIPMPGRLKPPREALIRTSGFQKILLLLLLAAVLLGFVYLVGTSEYPEKIQAYIAGIASSATHPGYTPAVRTPTNQPTSTPFPADPTMTSTSRPRPVLALDVPIGPENLLIHVIQGGETLDLIARRNGTTVPAVLAINYALHIPLWEGNLLVIPVDRVDVTGLPTFEALKVTETITVADLAQNAGISEEQIQQYNGLGTNESIHPGEYVLIPHFATPTPESLLQPGYPVLALALPQVGSIP